MLMACSACFLTHPRPPAQGSSTHCVLYPSTSIISQENAPTGLLTGHLDEDSLFSDDSSLHRQNNNKNLDSVAQCGWIGCSQEQGI